MRYPSPVVQAIFIAAFALWLPAHAADPRDTARLQACLDKAETKADEAYEDGLIWRNQGGGAFAGQCVAVAMIGQGRVEAGAQRLFDLAFASDAGTEEQRAILLTKAGNAWLLAGHASAARASLGKAIEYFPRDPDLRIDRARAAIELSEWAAAEKDLDLALAARTPEGLAYRLRSRARLEQGNLDGADADAAAALALDGKDIQALVLKGAIKEARRIRG